jgi:hypothetical protein
MSEASAAELTRQSMAVGGWSTALVMYSLILISSQ